MSNKKFGFTGKKETGLNILQLQNLFTCKK